MREKVFLLALLLPALVFSFGAKGAKSMYEPPPFQIPDGLSQEQVASSISNVITGRGWVIDSKGLSEGEGSSRFTASLHVRIHSLTIRIEFDTKQITFHYVDSKELKYEERDAVKYIHPKYTTWIKNIELDLGVALQNAASPS